MALLLLAAALGAPAQGKSVFRDCQDCPLMRALPAGGFIMGSPEREAGRGSAEGPRHRVVIPRPFAIGLYDVTRAQFAVFARETGYAGTPSATGDRPGFEASP